jgi:putative endonuclease
MKPAGAAAARGKQGELLAYRHLRKLGYTVVARNYRTRDGRGEVDLVAWDGPDLVFVEVKTRSGDEFGAPETAIDAPKRTQIARAAADYLRRSGRSPERVRFDTVSILLREPVRIEVRRDSFSERELTACLS